MPRWACCFLVGRLLTASHSTWRAAAQPQGRVAFDAIVKPSHCISNLFKRSSQCSSHRGSLCPCSGGDSSCAAAATKRLQRAERERGSAPARMSMLLMLLSVVRWLSKRSMMQMLCWPPLLLTTKMSSKAGAPQPPQALEARGALAAAGLRRSAKGCSKGHICNRKEEGCNSSSMSLLLMPPSWPAAANRWRGCFFFGSGRRLRRLAG